MTWRRCDAIRALFQLEDVIEDPKKLKKFLETKQLEKSKDPMERMLKLMRDGFKIGYALSGKNTSEFDEKTLRVVSPRFLSVMPEERDNKTVSFQLDRSQITLR